MAEVDVKLSQITPAVASADANTQVVAVHGGSADSLYSNQQFAGLPYITTIAQTYVNSINRADTDRFSDVINVKDFGAKGDNATDDTAAIQAAINAVSGGAIGKIYFPTGTYKIKSPGIQLPTRNAAVGSPFPSLTIEGSGAASIIASPAFNGFCFDDLNTSASQSKQATSSVWAFKNLIVKNTYTPGLIYRTAVAAGAWNAGAATIIINGMATGILPGAIVFEQSTGTFNTGSVPGYVGYVAPNGVAVGALTTTLTLGDTNGGNNPNGAAGGAQIPSSGPGTGTTDNLFYVQGYFATSTWAKAFSNTPQAITMAVTAPALDPGYYYVWDWTAVTAQQSFIPAPIGVTAIGVAGVTGWVGNTLTLTSAASVSSVGGGDLLVLSPVSGAIRHFCTVAPSIENCVLAGIIGATFDIAGMNPVDVAGGNTSFAAIEPTVKNTQVTAPSVGVNSSYMIGQHGLILPQSGMALNCDINSNWVGIRMFQDNVTMLGGRLETCAYGIVIGGIVTSQTILPACSGFYIANMETEGTWICDIGTDQTAGAKFGTIQSVFGTNSHQNCTFGLFVSCSPGLTVLNSNFASGPIGSTFNVGGFWNTSFAAGFTPSAIVTFGTSGTSPNLNVFAGNFADSRLGNYNVAQGHVTAAWSMPIKAQAGQFINNSNPGPIYTFANLPQPFVTTGQIAGPGGSGTSGRYLQFSAGSGFGSQAMPVGSAITGANVSPGTFTTGHILTSLNQIEMVNIASTGVVAGTQLTVSPMQDGQEYYISDSPIPYTPRYTASGNSISPLSSNATITLTANAAPAAPGMTIFNQTTKAIIATAGTVSGTTVNLNPTVTAGWTSGDTIIFYPLSNVGTPITVGGGSNHVKVRWSADLTRWVLV